jgi:predicted GTPase
VRNVIIFGATGSGVRNVIIFGATGSGKSSTVNMVIAENSLPNSGGPVAPTSNGATGCTFGSTPYDVNIDGHKYRLFDTAGLDEGKEGSVTTKDAIANLVTLVRDLAQAGGVHLIVHVKRLGRVTENDQKNYDMFYRGICQESVPVVAVITGCEDVEPEMASWWEEHGGTFEKLGMKFASHACITATPGKKNRYREEYDMSRGLVTKMIRDNSMEIGFRKVSLLLSSQLLRSHSNLIVTS